MADRGRVGSLVVGSRSCAQKVWRRDHEAHRSRIRKVKSATDMTMPPTMAMDHFRTNLKRERMLEERYMEIDRENQVLLNKMSAHMKKGNPYTKAGDDNKPTSMNRQGRKKDLMEITKENTRMLKAIQGVKPVYQARNWEKNFAETEVLLRNKCAYPVITRLPRERSAPSLLMQLEPGDGDSDVLAMTGSLSRQGSPGARGVEDDHQQFVLKEGKRIGGTYYLLEFATDGRVLNISAYDGETQTSLELIVKEQKHRHLYRAANGDYSVIASQLRVEGDRLIVDAGDGGVTSP